MSLDVARARRRPTSAAPPVGSIPHAGARESRGMARQTSAGSVALADMHPDLTRGLTPEQSRAAREALIVPAIEIEQGTWDPGGCVDDARITGAVLGLQVVTGILVREIVLRRRAAAQIYGPGDFLQVHDDRSERSLPVVSTVSVSGKAVLAVLDDRLLMAARRWPRLAGCVFAQAMGQAEHAGDRQAISQLARVEDRLLALFWQLADRWGRVRSDGISIELSITHEMVGHLVGARRPTVTLGLRKLRDQQLLRRDPDGVWLLAPDSLQRLRY